MENNIPFTPSPHHTAIKLGEENDKLRNENNKLVAEVAELKEQIKQKDRALMDHAEDWAFCGIAPTSEMGQRLAEHYRQREQERADLAILRARIAELEKERDEVISLNRTANEIVRINTTNLQQVRSALFDAERRNTDLENAAEGLAKVVAIVAQDLDPHPTTVTWAKRRLNEVLDTLATAKGKHAP